MKKRFYSVSNMLLSSAISMLGLGGCKTVVQQPEPVPVLYGSPPIIYVDDTIVVERRQEMKVVYGPPVVMKLDWNATPDAQGIYDVVELMPQFPGGDMAMNRWIAENIRIPEQARSEGAEGRVIVSFIVTATGKIDGVTVRRSVHPLLDAEAIRLVKAMPKWTPGQQKGEAVAVRYFIPVDFR